MTRYSIFRYGMYAFLLCMCFTYCNKGLTELERKEIQLRICEKQKEILEIDKRILELRLRFFHLPPAPNMDSCYVINSDIGGENDSLVLIMYKRIGENNE